MFAGNICMHGRLSQICLGTRCAEAAKSSAYGLVFAFAADDAGGWAGHHDPDGSYSRKQTRRES